MTPDDLRNAGAALYGRRGWRRPLADALGVHIKTIDNWSAGNSPIPRMAELAIDYLRETVDHDLRSTLKSV